MAREQTHAPALARVIAALLAIGAAAPAITAEAAEPPPRQDLCPRQEGCLEQCALADTTTETPSLFFLEKLTSIAQTNHHVDTVLGPARIEWLPWFRVVNVLGLPPEAVARWQQNRRFAGPCAVAAHFGAPIRGKHGPAVLPPSRK